MPERSARWPWLTCSSKSRIRAGDEPHDNRPSPRRTARAKSVICLFQHGGPSQMDLFDPKPALTKHHGKPYPGQLEIHFNTQAGKLLASPFRFSRRDSREWC